MFSQSDLSIINRDCFNIKTLGGAYVELQSQNGDWWILLETQESLSKRKRASGETGKTFYRIMHRHSNDNIYHDHAEYSNILDAVLEILDHDDFRLKRKKSQKRTPFDELLEEVGMKTAL